MTARRDPRPGRGGFTLAELMVVITVIMVTAALVVPRLWDTDRLRLLAASSVISSDIEMAQVMTIASPDEPVVVRFEPGAGRYWLARADAPDDPITREDTGTPYLVVLGQGRASSAEGVAMQVIDMAEDTLVFDAQGGVSDFGTSPQVRLTLGAESITVAISAATGSISEVE